MRGAVAGIATYSTLVYRMSVALTTHSPWARGRRMRSGTSYDYKIDAE
jgi:hypothetical protein